jgi:hypothetical protein
MPVAHQRPLPPIPRITPVSGERVAPIAEPDLAIPQSANALRQRKPQPFHHSSASPARRVSSAVGRALAQQHKGGEP